MLGGCSAQLHRLRESDRRACYVTMQVALTVTNGDVQLLTERRGSSKTQNV